MFTQKKQKNNQIDLYSVADGTLCPITEVRDDVFSNKMLGDGFAIKPIEESCSIISPIIGEVVSIFPTKHAICLKNSDGLEVLVHIGIDTVELKGEPFDILVKEGDKVTSKTVLASVDIAAIKDKEKQTDIIVIVTNNPYNEFSILDYGKIEKGSKIGFLL